MRRLSVALQLAFALCTGCGLPSQIPDGGGPGGTIGDAAIDGSTFACGAGFTCEGPPCTAVACKRATEWCQVSFNVQPTLASTNAEGVTCQIAVCEAGVTCGCALAGIFAPDGSSPCTDDGGVTVRTLESTP